MTRFLDVETTHAYVAGLGAQHWLRLLDIQLEEGDIPNLPPLFQSKFQEANGTYRVKSKFALSGLYFSLEDRGIFL